MSPSKSSRTTSIEPSDRALLGLPGVGEKTAARLLSAGLERLEDLLLFVPRRYDDAGSLRPIAEIKAGERVYVEGVVRAATVRRFFRRATLEVRIEDDGAPLWLRWFRFRGAVPERFAIGAHVRAAGLVRAGKRGLELNQPTAERVDQEGAALRPRYPQIRGVPARIIERLAAIAVAAHVVEPPGVPASLPILTAAARTLHALPPLPNAEERERILGGRSAAHRRLAFEELLLLRLRARMHAAEKTPGIAIEKASLSAFLSALPFSPTAAQSRAIAAVAEDLASARPMSRLLTGDVGSGKTLVAAAALELCCAAGQRGAFLAPTSILAEQQAATLARFLGGRRVVLLHAGTPRAERARLEAALAGEHGAIDIVVGTHALLADSLHIEKLALVVVDEQQRFGVAARAALVDKARLCGRTPHQLALSATPIPRTLALALRGELALAHLDEKPPGRLDTETIIIDDRELALAEVRAALAAGEQSYWICPQIEDAGGVREAAERLRKELDAEIVVCHGAQSARERGKQMAAFRAGAGLLVATTVVEVGVDVPGATRMIIEGAGRLGLSQLHQLRGRVGRGERQGRCLLLAPGESETERDRLQVLVNERDGLAIAEADLARRGMGDLSGVEQSGMPTLPSLGADELASLIEAADQAAASILAEDPELRQHARLRRAVDRQRARRYDARDGG